jgi:hypothetical protein
MRLSRAVGECLKLRRRVLELSFAHERAVEADKELQGTLLALGFNRDSAAWATGATGGEENFDLRLKRALRFLRG